MAGACLMLYPTGRADALQFNMWGQRLVVAARFVVIAVTIGLSVLCLVAASNSFHSKAGIISALAAFIPVLLLILLLLYRERYASYVAYSLLMFLALVFFWTAR